MLIIYIINYNILQYFVSNEAAEHGKKVTQDEVTVKLLEDGGQEVGNAVTSVAGGMAWLEVQPYFEARCFTEARRAKQQVEIHGKWPNTKTPRVLHIAGKSFIRICHSHLKPRRSRQSALWSSCWTSGYQRTLSSRPKALQLGTGVVPLKSSKPTAADTTKCLTDEA